MAGDTLTPTEQDQEDLATGRAVRRHLEGNLWVRVHWHCMALIQQALSLDAEVCQYTETDVRIGGESVGTWKIVVVKEGSEPA